MPAELVGEQQQERTVHELVLPAEHAREIPLRDPEGLREHGLVRTSQSLTERRKLCDGDDGLHAWCGDRRGRREGRAETRTTSSTISHAGNGTGAR